MGVGGLGNAVYVGAHLKALIDFLLVISELFSLGATAEELRANIDWNSPFLKVVGQFSPNFQVKP